jgi:signal transduction histidine kinase
MSSTPESVIATPESVIATSESRVHSEDQRAHVVQFYSEDGFLLDDLSKFIGTALVSGDAAVVIATSAHREGLARRLAARGLDLSRAMQWGRYASLDASETLNSFMVGALPDPERFRECIGKVLERAQMAGEGSSPRVFAFGEMVALLWAQGRAEAAVRLERLWNELAKTHSFHLRCAYPITAFNREAHAEIFLEICGEHFAVIPGESYTTLPTEEERHRTISQLQQKAQALTAEVAERKRVQDELTASREDLRKSHEELETRVLSRTRDLANAEARLGELSRKLLSLRDEERRRLARELHDSTGQTLAALELNLVMMQQENLAPKVADKLSESIRLADQALQEIRTMSYLLHPPMLDEAGLVLALEWYVEGFAQRSRMQVDLDLPSEYKRLPQEMELAIFRIVQEALTNVYRHSGSRSANVKLVVHSKHVELFVEDVGKGISEERIESGFAYQMGVGIRGMRERARHLGGELELSPTSPGTRVKVTLPVRDGKRAT